MSIVAAEVRMCGNKLELWYFSPSGDIEGFWEGLLEVYPDMDRDDKEWMQDLSEWNRKELPELLLELAVRVSGREL